jgi:hypothetical protein
MYQSQAARIEVEVSAGELLDKISILEIKSDRIKDPVKLANVETELSVLEDVVRQKLGLSEQVRVICQKLRSVNEALWEIEDRIRQCEMKNNFGPEFVKLARSVYQQNDLRAELKKQLNKLLGSRLVEEKSYAEYSTDL